ncbi:MAG: hypothetical protein ACOZE5_02440 [Verrucomicrobiota bacterium]
MRQIGYHYVVALVVTNPVKKAPGATLTEIVIRRLDKSGATPG